MVFQVLQNIFGYLEVNDRKEAGLVCKRWKRLTSIYRFAKECPLKLDGCVVQPRCAPKTVFSKLNILRRYPCVEIGCIPEYQQSTSDPTEFHKLFSQVGQFTTHLKLGPQFHKLILGSFPNLMELSLPSINDILHLETVPETVQALEVDLMFNTASEMIFNQLNAFAHIKSIKCKALNINYSAEPAPSLRELFQVSDEVVQFMQLEGVVNVIQTPKNLINGHPLGVEDVECLWFTGDFKDWHKLERFSNLKVPAGSIKF